MTTQKYIVVIPCIFLDVIYLAEVDGVVRPDYFNSEQEAQSEIKDYEKSYCDGDGDKHFLMLVTIDTAAAPKKSNKDLALGSEVFKDKVEGLYDRRVKYAKIGRPTKVANCI